MAAKPVPCKSCKALIRFVTGPNGRSVPIDLEPVADGEYYLSGTPIDSFLVRVADVAENEGNAGQPRYTSHFKTCDDPQRFSHKQGAREKS